MARYRICNCPYRDEMSVEEIEAFDRELEEEEFLVPVVDVPAGELVLA